MTPDCKPAAVQARNCSQINKDLIASEMKEILRDDVIIEESKSSQRAEVVVVKNDNHKKCIDYIHTVNKFT